MTEEDKRLIEAANTIKEHCENSKLKDHCPFAKRNKECDGDINCFLVSQYSGIPKDWKIPKVSRWTDADVALAKALIAFGVTKITRLLYEDSVVYDGKSGVFSCNNCVPYDAFEELNQDETVYLEDIVAEGENYG